MVPMKVWVSLLWIICAMLTCWGFSLTIRLISEFVARTRKRLNPHYSLRSTKFAIALAMVCFGVAGFSGFMGKYTSDIYRDAGMDVPTPFSLISGSIVCFGFLMMIVWLIGDRARGRVRCPKCWYDMADSMDLPCPECEHQVTKHTQLGKPRRAKKSLIVAMVLLTVSGYLLLNTKRVNAYGPFALVPTWVLMFDWDQTPDSWLYDKKAGLIVRIQDNWIGRGRMQRFANRLAMPIASNADERWNSNRISMLAFLTQELQSDSFFNDRVQWVPKNIDLDVLLRATAQDVIDAITTTQPRAIDDAVIDSMWDSNTLWLVEQWIANRSINDGLVSYEEAQNTTKLQLILAEVLSPLREQLLDESFLRAINHDDDTFVMYATILTYQTNTAIEHIYQVFELAKTSDVPIAFPTVYRLPDSIDSLEDESKNEVINRLMEMAKSDDPRQIHFMLDLAGQLVQRNRRSSGLPNSVPVEYEPMIRFLITQHSTDTRIPFEKNRPLVLDVADLVGSLNEDVEPYFPYIREQMDLGNHDYYEKISWDQKFTNTHAWIEHFGDIDQPESQVAKTWLTYQFPTRADPETRPQLMQLLRGYVNDPEIYLGQAQAKWILEEFESQSMQELGDK